MKLEADDWLVFGNKLFFYCKLKNQIFKAKICKCKSRNSLDSITIISISIIINSIILFMNKKILRSIYYD